MRCSLSSTIFRLSRMQRVQQTILWSEMINITNDAPIFFLIFIFVYVMTRGKRRMENQQKICIFFFETLKLFFERKNVWRGVHVAVLACGTSAWNSLAFVLDFESIRMVIADCNCLLEFMLIESWCLPLCRRGHPIGMGHFRSNGGSWMCESISPIVVFRISISLKMPRQSRELSFVDWRCVRHLKSDKYSFQLIQ